MRNPFCGIKSEFRCCPKQPLTVGALLFGIVWLIVLSIVGSPRSFLQLIALRTITFPPWLFLLLMLALFVICGGSIGMVFGNWRRGCELSRYRGAFFFTVAITLCYLWYALFFGARFFLPSLLLSAIVCFCFMLAAMNFRKVFRAAAVGMWIAFGISAYLFFLSLFCFFLL